MISHLFKQWITYKLYGHLKWGCDHWVEIIGVQLHTSLFAIILRYIIIGLKKYLKNSQTYSKPIFEATQNS